MEENIENQGKGIMPTNGNWYQFVAGFEDVCADSTINWRYTPNFRFESILNFRWQESREIIAFGRTQALESSTQKKSSKACHTCQSTYLTHDGKICRNTTMGIDDIDQEQDQENKEDVAINSSQF